VGLIVGTKLKDNFAAAARIEGEFLRL